MKHNKPLLYVMAKYCITLQPSNKQLYYECR